VFKNTHQIAYVTNDMTEALRVFEQEGVTEVAVFEGFTVQGATGSSTVFDVGLCWVGDVQLEIISPVSGSIDHYLSVLPEGPEFALRFHHLCNRIDDAEEFDRILQSYRDRGYAIPLDATFGSTRFFYVDTVADLGHFQEYFLSGPETEAFQAMLPRN
jgi:hypothetical protein